MPKYFIDTATFQLMDYSELKARPEFNDPHGTPGWPSDPMNTSLDDLLAPHGIVRFHETAPPSVEPWQVAIEGTPNYFYNKQAGRWEQKWETRNMSKVELAELNDELQRYNDAARADRYAKEADPLYFKAQRGEIDKQKWIDKIEQIRAELPTPALITIPD